MKLGDRVFLKFSPDVKGTITRIDNGRIRVTYDSVDRKPGQRRIRHWLRADALSTGMEIGVPS